MKKSLVRRIGLLLLLVPSLIACRRKTYNYINEPEQEQEYQYITDCYFEIYSYGGEESIANNLYNGFNISLSVKTTKNDEDLNPYDLKLERIDVYIFNCCNTTIFEDIGPSYKGHFAGASFSVEEEKAAEINNNIKTVNGFTEEVYYGEESWKNNPFTVDNYNVLYRFELYYEVTKTLGEKKKGYVSARFKGYFQAPA